MNRLRTAVRRDDGLGLVEIMISLVILGIAMIAMLTLLVAAINSVAKNNTRATATELATQRLEDARVAALTGDCAFVTAAITPSKTTYDGRGVPLQVAATVANCDQTGVPDPHDAPRLARVTVTVTTTQPGFQTPVATVASDIYVHFESK